MVAVDMSADEIDDLLGRQGVGTLSLADDDETYAIPESFGYDGEHLYFQLVRNGESRKMRFIETTGTATFTVWVEQPARSVVVRGTIEPVPAGDEMAASNAIAENATLPTLNVVPDSTVDQLEMDYYRLVPDELTGRKFGAEPEPIAD